MGWMTIHQYTPYIHEIFQYPIYQWIGLRDNFSRNAPIFFMGKSMVPGVDFPDKTNGMFIDHIHLFYIHGPMICSIHHIPMIYPWYTHDIPMIYPWYTHDIFHPFFLPIPVKSPVKSASGQGVAATTDANWVPGRWKTKFDQDTKWAPKR